MSQNDIALIGLAVMGQNLVLNMNDNGFKVAVYNRTTEVTDEFINGPAKGTEVVGFHDLKEMVESLSKPRRIVILVKAGPAVDAVIEQLVPLVDEGDVIVDLGNTHFPDTERRWKELKKKRSASSVPVFRVAKKVPVLVLRSCLVVIQKHGHWSKTSSKPSRRKSTASHAATGLAMAVPVTT